MKSWILATTATAALLSSLTAGAALATPAGDVSSARDAIYQSWSLSDQQKSQLATERTQFHERLKALMDQKFDSSQARHIALQDAALAHHKALAAVLDADQLQVLKGLEQRAAPRQAKGALMHALYDSWKLDNGQRQAINDARQQMRSDLQAMRNHQGTTDHRETRRQAMDKLRDEQHKRLASVLSDEQIHVLEMMRHVELRGAMGKPPIDMRRALVKSWHLDQSQLDALKAADDKRHQQMMRLHSDDDLARDVRGQQRVEAQKAFHEQLEGILNPVQLTALDSVTPHRGHGMKPPYDSERGQAPHGKGMTSSASKPQAQ